MTVVTMKKGSNLSSMVNSYNRSHGTRLTVAQVARQNGLKDPNKVGVGQRIRLGDGFERPRADQKKRPVLNPQLPQFKVSNQKNAPVKMQPCVEPNKVKQLLDENRRKLNENPLMKAPDFKLTPFKLKF